MRRALLAITIALTAWGCDSTEPSVATNVVLTPTSLAFDAVGQRDTIVAEVRDQRGKPMSGVAVAWSSEGTAVTVVPLGADSAIITAVGNGAALVRASAGGSAVAQTAATVSQAPVSITAVGGANQIMVVGSALAPIVVSVRDRRGNGVAGVRVTFSVTRGDGTLSATEGVTDNLGSVSVVWTLGTSTSTGQELTATTEGIAAPAVIAATATVGPATGIVVIRGNNQTAPTSSWVNIAPTIRVIDRYANGVPFVSVSFSVTQGGGTVYGGSGMTGQTGDFAVQGWALGMESGVNILRARIPGTDFSVDFHATALTPPTIGVSSGVNQAGMVNTPLPVSPSFVVRDTARNPIPGVRVNFTVVEGGGTLATPSAVTDANGIASPGEWTLGPIANRNRITARAEFAGLESIAASVDAYGCSGGSPVGYSITLCFLTTVTTAQRQAFETAAARWSNIIAGDLPDFFIRYSTPCLGLPYVEMNVDDVMIFVSILDLDGSGGLLGQAGPCQVRANILPYAGLMQFDRVDVLNLSPGLLETLILHEMGHVIGIGSLWKSFDLLVDGSSTTNKQDTYYSGAAGRAAFDAIGGTAYTAGRKVPVENEGGQGTMNSHWRESVLRNELMTGYIRAGANPLSLLTVRSLEDLGYTVNRAAADPFTYTPTPSLRAGVPDTGGVDLGNDVLDIPLWVTDESGREVRIR